MSTGSILARVWPALIAFALGSLGAGLGAQDRSAATPVLPGDRFPAATFANLNAGAAGPDSIDLAAFIGKKPVILYYWIATSRRSEELFQQLQELVGELGPDRLSFWVLRRGPERGVVQIRQTANFQYRSRKSVHQL